MGRRWRRRCTCNAGSEVRVGEKLVEELYFNTGSKMREGKEVEEELYF